ncbi:nucleophosmin-like isoform X2 [Pleurodeles waltl]|uniref:nucleophosmin-like isoform X2 n=1 Tax=Pleurodeles waltl TaxID=8319 RepID=UPI0037099411
MCLHPFAKEEIHTVELEMPDSKRKCAPVKLGSLKPNSLNTLSLGGCALTPPVTIRLTSGSGPVYIRGQHVIGQNVFKSEEENNSSPIKRPFKHETSTSVHPVKKLKVLQYDDVSEKDSDHDEDEDDGSDVCEVPMPPPEVIDLTAIDGEESSSGLSTSDDESSSRRSPTDVIQKVIAWNQNRKYLERMTKQSLENLRRVVDLSQDNPFLPGHLKDGNCTEQDDKKPKKL